MTEIESAAELAWSSCACVEPLRFIFPCLESSLMGWIAAEQSGQVSAPSALSEDYARSRQTGNPDELNSELGSVVRIRVAVEHAIRNLQLPSSSKGGRATDDRAKGVIAVRGGVGIQRRQVNIVATPHEVADEISSGAGQSRLVEGVEVEDVDTSATSEDILACSADQAVVACTARHYVVADSAVEHVGSTVAGQCISHAVAIARTRRFARSLAAFMKPLVMSLDASQRRRSTCACWR